MSKEHQDLRAALSRLASIPEPAREYGSGELALLINLVCDEVDRLRASAAELDGAANRDMVKDALNGHLRAFDKDEIIFRRCDGSPVSIGEALDMLDRNDPDILEFLRDVYAVAVRAVRVKSKRATP